MAVRDKEVNQELLEQQKAISEAVMILAKSIDQNQSDQNQRTLKAKRIERIVGTMIVIEAMQLVGLALWLSFHYYFSGYFF